MNDDPEIASILGRVPDLEPPDDLHERIMSSISLRPAKAPRPGAHIPSPFVFLRYGAALAAGMLLAVLFFENRTPLAGPGDLSALVGTMAPGTGGELLDSHTFRADGIESRARLQRRDGALVLELGIDADKPLDLSVDLTASGARLGGLVQGQPPLESIEVAARTLHLRAVGRRHLTLLLHRTDDAVVDNNRTIDLEFSSEGKLLQRVSLTPAW